MGQRILVIEDNPASLNLITYLLHAFGHEAIGASNGAEGLESARNEKPDLILCDIQLPNMSGHDVCRELKNDDAVKQIPLVAVTAFAMVGDREMLLSEGFDGYISKPINPETFIDSVTAFFDDQSPVKALYNTADAQPSSTIPLRSAKPNGRKKSILVLDNTKANSRLMQVLLEANGFDVVVCSSVREALTRLAEKKPDLIISDIHLPEKDGFDFLRDLKDDEKLKELPFVFLTASYWGRSDRKKAAAMGADKFIVQPVEPEVLMSEISELLQSKRSDV